MKVEILDEAIEDLAEGFGFYERQRLGLGRIFLDTLYSEIDLLAASGGIHPIVFGRHRALSRRFPFAIYYAVEKETVYVHAVLDCRPGPAWLLKRLGGDQR